MQPKIPRNETNAKPVEKSLPNQVPAKDFARKIGQYQRQALVKPITITAHGEPQLVLLSVAEYRRLKRRDREAIAIDQLSPEQAQELIDMLAASRPAATGDEYDNELDGWTP